MKKRVAWIDICKGLCIISIVLMHIDFPLKNNIYFGVYLTNFFSLFGQIVFFVLSGITLNEEKLNNTKSFIISKIKSIYRKILIYGILAILLHNQLIRFGFYTEGLEYSGKIMKMYSFVDILKQIIFTFVCANREVVIGPMWFVNVLFMALVGLAITQMVLQRITKDKYPQKRLFVCSILMIVAWIFTDYLKLNIPRCNNVFTVMFILTFAQYYKDFFQKSNIWKYIMSIILCFVMPIFGYISINSNHIENPIFFIIAILSSGTMLVIISKQLEKTHLCQILSYIGKSSFHIMAQHFLWFKVAIVILNLFNHNLGLNLLKPNINSIYETMIIMVVGICGPLLICLIMDKVYVKRLEGTK